MTTATATPVATWKGQVEIKTSFIPTGETKRNGPKLRPVRSIKIHLTRGYDAIQFNVTHRNGQTSITDHRETATGATGTKGVFSETGSLDFREGKSAGRPKSYTPSGWANEVERLIGWSEAIALLMEAGVDF